MNAVEIKEKILESLQEQGFKIHDGSIFPPLEPGKEALRKLHALAVSHRIDIAEPKLKSHERRLLSRIASGIDLIPERVRPQIVEVHPGSEEELLFRYASLHWSIPVSSGYGRRLRFLVIDESNGKLIGLFGLGDPVFSLSSRDRWIGWNAHDRRDRLHHVMDAFVVGAVPPYSFLLCGKLVAMLLCANEVRDVFSRKYSGKQSLIQQRSLTGKLAMITTSSALGRSSIYSRIRFQGRPMYISVGYTHGSGEFHFSNGLYSKIREFVEEQCEPTAKQERWGTGFRNKREVIRKCLAEIGLSSDCIYHGITRQVFVVPLAHNTQAFLTGRDSSLQFFDCSIEDLFEHFRARWLLPRAERDRRYAAFNTESYRIWDSEGKRVWEPNQILL